jgi:hypothetical protein
MEENRFIHIEGRECETHTERKELGIERLQRSIYSSSNCYTAMIVGIHESNVF